MYNDRGIYHRSASTLMGVTAIQLISPVETGLVSTFIGGLLLKYNLSSIRAYCSLPVTMIWLCLHQLGLVFTRHKQQLNNRYRIDCDNIWHTIHSSNIIELSSVPHKQ